MILDSGTTTIFPSIECFTTEESSHENSESAHPAPIVGKSGEAAVCESGEAISGEYGSRTLPMNIISNIITDAWLRNSRVSESDSRKDQRDQKSLESSHSFCIQIDMPGFNTKRRSLTGVYNVGLPSSGANIIISSSSSYEASSPERCKTVRRLPLYRF